MEVVFDGRRIRSRDDFYAEIERIEGVPDWFGRNLDALFDLVLAVLPGPLTIRWTHAEASAEAMGADFGVVVGVLRDAEGESKSEFKLRLCKGATTAFRE
ncbi:barstar family protein [Brevundimonas faecalis]|uniref:RNAse (Barnase) inhibitor barstar n=1 Tax=Brevundimonas faecalis TaxID=947378 RepID=A0ABV2REE3_9CAUL